MISLSCRNKMNAMCKNCAHGNTTSSLNSNTNLELMIHINFWCTADCSVHSALTEWTTIVSVPFAIQFHILFHMGCIVEQAVILWLVVVFRMDMVITSGKSRKNVNAYILIPPDAKEAIELLISMREEVGVPSSNSYVFARMSSDTPLTGCDELTEVAKSCKGLKCPERIKATSLRKYIATVSQVL